MLRGIVRLDCLAVAKRSKLQRLWDGSKDWRQKAHAESPDLRRPEPSGSL